MRLRLCKTQQTSSERKDRWRCVLPCMVIAQSRHVLLQVCPNHSHIVKILAYLAFILHNLALITLNLAYICSNCMIFDLVVVSALKSKRQLDFSTTPPSGKKRKSRIETPRRSARLSQSASQESSPEPVAKGRVCYSVILSC